MRLHEVWCVFEDGVKCFETPELFEIAKLFVWISLVQLLSDVDHALISTSEVKHKPKDVFDALK